MSNLRVLFSGFSYNSIKKKQKIDKSNFNESLNIKSNGVDALSKGNIDLVRINKSVAFRAKASGNSVKKLKHEEKDPIYYYLVTEKIREKWRFEKKLTTKKKKYGFSKDNIKMMVESLGNKPSLDKIKFANMLINSNDKFNFSAIDIKCILQGLGQAPSLKKIKFAKNLIEYKKEYQIDGYFMGRVFNYLGEAPNQEKLEAAELVVMKRAFVLDNADLFVNKYQKKYRSLEIKKFFDDYLGALILFATTFNEKTLDTVLRRKIDNAKPIIFNFATLQNKNRVILAKINKNNDVNRYLTEESKLELLSLMKVYENLGLDTKIFKKIAVSPNIDFDVINVDKAKKIIKKLGFTDEEIAQIPFEKIFSLDHKYVNLVPKASNLNLGMVVKDFYHGVMLEDNFITYLHDDKNVYGQVNKNTKEQFETLGLDYNKWIQPTVKPAKFKIEDSNKASLEQLSLQIAENIQGLYNNGLKNIVGTRFEGCMKDGQFKVPIKFQKDKEALEFFLVKSLNKLIDLPRLFQKTSFEDNFFNDRSYRSAIFLENLEQCKFDLLDIDDSKKEKKNIDLTIKMWDRDNPNNLFQGNYSSSTIGLGRCNGKVMPLYIMNTAFNMLELIDNKTGDIIGNALCYFVKDDDGNPIFLLDNIKIGGGHLLSDEASKKLRTEIINYVAKVAKDVTGKDDCLIYLSNASNNVYSKDLQEQKKKISFLGDLFSSKIYTDLFGDWEHKSKMNQFSEKNILILKDKNS